MEESAKKEMYEYLRSQSGYYPQVFAMDEQEILFLSTLVRIQRDGTWFVLHMVQELDLSTGADPVEFALEFGASVYLTQYLYKLNGTVGSRDYLQVSEQERLTAITSVHNEQKQQDIPG